MDTILRKFIEKLKKGPSVLFLGQGSLSLDSGKDLFLDSIIKKYSQKSDTGSISYDEILDSKKIDEFESRLAWMQNLSNRIAVPDSLKIIGRYPWNSVFSSCIDNIWHRAFETEFRQLYRICSERFNPEDQRNRIVLHCTYLFGCVERGDIEDIPPLDLLSKIHRDMAAQNLAQRIPQLVTALGTFVVEGYSPHNDWFEIKKFYPILNQLDKGQTHFFNTKFDPAEDPILNNLHTSGKLIFHQESLSEIFSLAEQGGLISLKDPPAFLSTKHTISVADYYLEIPQEIWRSISKTCTLVDDQLLVTPPEVSEDKKYTEFREFLRGGNFQKLCNGLMRGFAFERNYEKDLYKIISYSISQRIQQTTPIILHGASGTGKTMALYNLAKKFREKEEAIVIIIERDTYNFSQETLDKFLNWLEDINDSPVLIIWDGMQEVWYYTELLQFLAGRGRKNITLVGTCYSSHITTLENISINKVEAPHELNVEEFKEFQIHLNKIDKLFESLSQVFSRKNSESFLSAIYRLLPTSRYRLRQLLLREVESAEDIINKLSKKINIQPSLSDLAVALQVAGFSCEQGFLSDEILKIAGEEKNTVQLIVDLVMVPGQFGICVPIELLFRTIGRNFSENFVNILYKSDIMVWFEDLSGNIGIKPRQTLEAQLIVQSRLGGANHEADVACRLIENIKDPFSFGSTHEMIFAVELIRNMGPNGPQGLKYKDSYLNLADSLEKLRLQYSIINPRLMLHEGNLIRETVKAKSSDLEPTFRSQLLERAATILTEGIDHIRKKDPRNKFMIDTLQIELASIIGSKSVEEGRVCTEIDRPYNTYKKVRDLLSEISHSQRNYQIILDVLAWTADPILRATSFCDDKIFAEIAADVQHAFDLVDISSLDLLAFQQFNKRKLQLAETLKNFKLSNEAFDSLRISGSCAGYYYRAKKLVGDIFHEKKPSDNSLTNAEKAYDYLIQHEDMIKNDYKCYYLQFNLWWLIKCKCRMFSGDRLTFPFDESDWDHVLRCVSKLLLFPELSNHLYLKYLLAVSHFHKRQYGLSKDMFRELEIEAQNMSGSRRIFKSYLASLPSGQPIKFSGSVSRIIPEKHRGFVWVEQIRQTIPFFFRDFVTGEISEGDPLSDFHIAFNFIGMIADHYVHYQKRTSL